LGNCHPTPGTILISPASGNVICFECALILVLGNVSAGSIVASCSRGAFCLLNAFIRCSDSWQSTNN
jgi:hypothetical protein